MLFHGWRIFFKTELLWPWAIFNKRCTHITLSKKILMPLWSRTRQVLKGIARHVEGFLVWKAKYSFLVPYLLSHFELLKFWSRTESFLCDSIWNFFLPVWLDVKVFSERSFNLIPSWMERSPLLFRDQVGAGQPRFLEVLFELKKACFQLKHSRNFWKKSPTSYLPQTKWSSS